MNVIVDNAPTAVFDRTSLSVRVSGPTIPFSYDNALKPVSVPDLRIRRWFHELVHLWQLFGSGYLANLALGQLDAVLDSGKDPSLLGAFRMKDRGAEFSAYDIHECLAQYWELHVLNPVAVLREKASEGVDIDGALEVHGLSWSDLERTPEVATLPNGTLLTDNSAAPTVTSYTGAGFDFAMLVEARYSAPYQFILSQFGSRVSAVLFPLVSHFALQTRRPQSMYAALIDRLAEESFGASLSSESDIHTLWRKAYPDIAAVAYQLAPIAAATAITPGWQLWPAWKSHSKLARHYAALIKLAYQIHGSGLDLALALPGDPEFRPILASYLLPAVTVFDDGTACEVSSMAKMCLAYRQMYPEGPLAEGCQDVLDADELAQESLAVRSIKEKWEAAGLLASYGLSAQ